MQNYINLGIRKTPDRVVRVHIKDRYGARGLYLELFTSDILCFYGFDENFVQSPSTDVSSHNAKSAENRWGVAMVLQPSRDSMLTETELGYACQFERTVKKRGPKPKSQRTSDKVKHDLDTGLKQPTYPSPKSPSSDDIPWLLEGPSLCTGAEGSAQMIDSDVQSATSEVCSSIDVPGPLAANMASFMAMEATIPICGHFPLDLSPFPISTEEISSMPSCQYPCLTRIVPLLRGTMTADDACNLLDIFFADPETAGPASRCPYVLSPVIRKQSLLRKKNPRPVSAALLMVILWCVSHTANLGIFPNGTVRARVTQRLYYLSMKLLRARDSDNWHRADGGWVSECDMPLYGTSVETIPSRSPQEKPDQNVDDVLSYILLTCVVSGTEYREECLKWWNKAVRLVKRLGYDSEARIAENTPSSQQMSLAAREDHEERRRAFWHVYALDRHLAFSFNEPLHILDFESQVLCPLPECIWQRLDQVPLGDIPPRTVGPPAQVTGTGFFEYFLPLMTILGDIIEIRLRNQHPRLGGVDESSLMGLTQTLLDDCQYSLDILEAMSKPFNPIMGEDNLPLILPTSPNCFGDTADRANGAESEQQTGNIVVAYSRYMLQVLQLLLHGDLDAFNMPHGHVNCAPVTNLFTCMPKALTTCDSIEKILEVDSQLSFMPYIFGPYLFHGGLNFLSIADQMARAGADDLAKHGCDLVVRAHEVALKALDTSFQVTIRPFAEKK
ncbi:fungal specific transcription factor domain-containing protein [Aspergillus mulundensis]|uniref:Xylanolytic transcriptional activator regulatory domain-containing protein n=1 Tax=Aspergillus mulundensis TaxID=1810919 RepID=A0A3D8QIT1_9EURO|nr:hypothetical protein DSM5745_10387 [Aspergillus mulundensis]RDW61715.1 hypothetical protein DSM5745_10387 [Aspergillus mulundensis]